LTIEFQTIVNRQSTIVNLAMARGWESKSIEQQIEDARADSSPSSATSSSSEDFEGRQKREGLLLQRSRILQEINSARNPRYQEMLHEMLRHLDGLLASKDS
jgi:hypothetical protein